MKYDYEDYEKFVTDQKLNLWDAYCDENHLEIEFDDFDKWIKENKQEDEFEKWAWDKFENYRQNADEVIYGD